MTVSQVKLSANPDSTTQVLYIGALGRSGSTILDNVIGQAQGVFSAGELRLSWDPAGLVQRPCGCGTAVQNCEIWSQVLDEAPDASSRPRGRAARYPDRLGDWPAMWLYRPRRLADAERRRLAARYQRLARSTGNRVIVDSSKTPAYSHVLQSVDALDLYMLHLVRDPRGVAYSWQKRQQQRGLSGPLPMRRNAVWRSALRWVFRNATLERAWSRRQGRYRRLRYEDFIANPLAEYRAILDWLDCAQQPHPFVSSHQVELGPNHTVWGNPSRFKTGVVTLRADQEWEDKLPRGQQRLVRWITWPLLRRYGYR